MRKIPLCENNVSIYFILKTLKQKKYWTKTNTLIKNPKI